MILKDSIMALDIGKKKAMAYIENKMTLSQSLVILIFDKTIDTILI